MDHLYYYVCEVLKKNDIRRQSTVERLLGQATKKDWFPTQRVRGYEIDR